jgi:hypothetical protein
MIGPAVSASDDLDGQDLMVRCSPGRGSGCGFAGADVAEFKRVTDKENLLFRVAEATVNAGDQLVRDTVFPAASQAVLADLVAEFKSSGPTYQRTVKATLKGSYTNHYRTGLVKLLDVLEFRSNTTTHRPVLDALELITRHASAGNLHYYPAGEDVPVHRGLGGDWEALVYKDDTRRRRRVVRMVYEVCAFHGYERNTDETRR